MFILAGEIYMSSSCFLRGLYCYDRQLQAELSLVGAARGEQAPAYGPALHYRSLDLGFSLGVLKPRSKDPSMRRAMPTPSGALYCRHHFGFSDLQVVAQAPETFVAGYPLNRRQVDPAA